MRITLYMLHPGTQLDKTALREGNSYIGVELDDIDDVECHLFIDSTTSYEPKWVGELRRLTNSTELSRLQQQSSSAVLLLKQEDHSYALTFGGGYHAVEPSKLERGFGIRVAANVITGRVKSADTRGLNREGRSAKVIVPTAGELEALGIEPSEEWVRQLSGPVAVTDFATSAAGADSLRLNIRDFELTKLPVKLREISKHWKSKAYKSHFAFLDNFTQLGNQDPIVATLNAELAALLQAKSTDVYFAAPEPFEQLNVEKYQLVLRKRRDAEELTQTDIYEALDALKPKPGEIWKVRVEALDSDGKKVDKTYRIHDYVQAEIPKGSSRYVLTAGAWFRVDEHYVKEVRQQVAQIEDLSNNLNLPDWPAKSSGDGFVDEGDYNAYLATSRNYALLDKRNLTIYGQQRVEICDLLTPEKLLLCVKRATKSSTLSHLFTQGSVSAALMHLSTYQKRLEQGLAEANSTDSFGSAVEWKIVYAIGTEKPGALADSLFFFSQVALLMNVRDIRSRNISVAIARIEMRTSP